MNNVLKTALIVSVLSFALFAYANSETQSGTETTAQTEEVVEMVGVRNHHRHDGGGVGGGGGSLIVRGPIDSSLAGRSVARGGNDGLKNFNALDKNTTNVVSNKNNAFSQTSPSAGQGASLKNVQDGRGSEERHGVTSDSNNNKNDRDIYDLLVDEGNRLIRN